MIFSESLHLAEWLALFGQNVTTGFVAVALVGTLNQAVEDQHRLVRSAIVGIVFGCAGLISMINPVHISEGVILDMRNVFALVGGIVGGPVGALVSGGLIAAYRVYLGGAGVVSGVAGVVLSALVGGVVGWRFGPRTREFGLPGLGAIGLLAALATIASTRVYFALKGLPPLPESAEAAVLVIYPVATAIFVTAMSMTHYRVWRRTQGRLADMLDTAMDLIWETDAQGRMTFVSRRYQEVLGFAPAEVIGRTSQEMGGRWIDAATQRAYETAVANRQRYEGLLRVRPARDGSKKILSITARPHFDRRGAFTGYRGSATDITERERWRELVATISNRVDRVVGRAFLRTLVQALAEVLDAELAYIGRFDLETAILHGLHSHQKGPPSGRYAKERYLRLEGLPSAEVAQGQTVIIQRGLAQRYPEFEAASGVAADAYAGMPLFDAAGKVFGMLSAASLKSWDSVESVEAVLRLFAGRAAAELEKVAQEEELRQSYERLAAAQRIGKIGTKETDLRTGKSYWSDESYRIIGLEPGSIEPTPENFRAFVHPDDLDQFVEFSSDMASRACEYRIVRASGEVRWVFRQAELVRDENGNAIRMVATIQDITDRKRLEEQLRSGRDRLELAQRVGQIGSIEADLVNGDSVWSDELHRILGLEPGSLATNFQRFLESVHPDDRDMLVRLRGRTAAGVDNEPSEFRVVCPDGTVRWVHREARLIRDAHGKAAKLVATIQDVTERRAMAEAVRLGRDRLVRAQRVAKMGSLEANLRTGEIAWSDELFQLYGLDPASGSPDFARFSAMVHPDDRSKLFNVLALPDRVTSVPPAEFRVMRSDGQYRWIYRYAEIVPDNAGAPAQIIITMQDITELRKVEAELHKSHDLLAQAQRMGRIGSAEFDYVSGETAWSDEQYRLFGLDPAAGGAGRALFLSLIHPADRERVRAVRDANVNGIETPPTEFRIVLPEGEVRWMRRDVELRRDEDGRPVKFVTATQDITERRQLEDALRRSFERLARAQRTGSLGSAEIDFALGEEFWSDELYRMFGLDPASTAPGYATFLELVHPDDRERLNECVRLARQGIAVDPLDFRLTRPDGVILWLHREAEFLRDEDGDVHTIVATFLDITARKRMEDELAAREANLLRATRHLAAAQRAGRMGSVEHDPVTGDSTWSAEAYRLFGVDPARGEPGRGEFIKRVHPEDRPVLDEILGQELQGIQTKPIEYRLLRDGGETRWMYRQAELVRGDDGKPSLIIISHQDVTEREKWRRLIESMNRSVGNLIGEEFLRSLVANIAQMLDAGAVYIGRFENGSRQIRTQYLYLDGQFVENRIIPIAGRPSEVVAKGQTLVVAGNVIGRYPGPYRSVEGAQSYAGTPLFSAKGELLGLLAVVSARVWDSPNYVEAVIELFARRAAAEIERLAIEAEADASRGRMAEVLAALDAAKDAIVLADDERRIIYLNESAVRLLGLPPSMDEIIGKRLRDFQSSPESLVRFDAILTELDSVGEWSGLADWVRPNDKVPLVADVNLHRLPQGGFVAMAVDAAPRLKLEEEQRERQQRETQASKLEVLGNLAGGIAHDFNNLLGAILGFGQFLTKDLDPKSPQYRYAARIVGASQRGRSLIQQILSFSRRSSVEPARIALADSIAEIRDLLHATLPPSTEIAVEMRDKDALIMGDRAQVLQVLLNLCVNANDALMGEDGTVTLAIDRLDREREELRRLAVAEGKPTPAAVQNWTGSDGVAFIATGAVPPGPCVSLTVRDTGKGIPAALHGQMFQPFVTTKGKGRGTGLGLAVVHRIVLEHGGAILIRTREGAGTEFEVLLPLAEAAAKAKPKRAARAPRAAAKAAQSASILVVDDDESFCAMVETALTRLHYKVEATNDPRVALSWLKRRSSHWDVLVTDQSMPHIKGQDLVRTFKAERPETKCVMCTGYSSGLDERKARKLGADAFLIKPFDVDQLAAVVAKLVEKEGAPSR